MPAVWLAILIGAGLAPAATPAGFAPSAAKQEAEQLPIRTRKWTGDLDGMVKRREIRALVVFSRTQYFVDKGRELVKFQRVVDLFRTYGDRYDLDHLLMMAQGYQESQLDQSAKSRVGAVGIMQIMPGTGQQLKVGDIRQLEPNIHGGVKYIRFMVDHYFAKEPMDRLDRGLFAFAAYNAGPGRVTELRREAARRGLDPNVWFNNVEVVAAERIGSETVTYVSNIYKYYIAYRLIAEEQAERQRAREQLEKKP